MISVRQHFEVVAVGIAPEGRQGVATGGAKRNPWKTASKCDGRSRFSSGAPDGAIVCELSRPDRGSRKKECEWASAGDHGFRFAPPVATFQRPFGAERLVLGLLTAMIAAALAWPLAALGGETVTHPFAGVTHVERTEVLPRPLRMHVVLVDLATPGIRFLVTPPSGPKATVKETTRAFLGRTGAQAAVNLHYFEPWPPPKPDSGAVDLVGLAASEGRVYSAFDAAPPKAFAIHANAPGLNIDAYNHATIVHRSPADPTGRTVAEPVTLWNAFAGNEEILAGGENVASTGAWDQTLNPHTVVGLAPRRVLLVFTVDGRQPGVSEGMTTSEVADLLRRDYGVTDALNLDGGGSTTLCLADPVPRVVNVPVGLGPPGTERPVGSNLAIFAPMPSAWPVKLPFIGIGAGGVIVAIDSHAARRGGPTWPPGL